MNRSFIRNLAFVVMFSILLALIALPIQDTILARAQATASATPSKTAPTTAKGIPRIVFVANKNGATNIFAMNPDGKNIVQLTNSGDIKTFPTFSPDGRQIAFLSTTRASETLQLKVMDADGKNLRQLPLGEAVTISPPAWSPDSSEMAYVSIRVQPKDTGLYIINVPKQQETKLKLVTPVEFSYNPNRQDSDLKLPAVPSWSPDGKSLLVYGGLGNGSEQGSLLISLSDGSARAFLQDSSFIAINAIWSPDGSKVLVTALKKEKEPDAWFSLQLTNAKGEILTEIHPTSYVNDNRQIRSPRPEFPAWSPNSKRIAFAESYTFYDFVRGPSRIFVMTIDSLVAYQITEDDFSDGDYFPSWGLVPAEFVKGK